VDETGCKDFSGGYEGNFGRGNWEMSLLEVATNVLQVFNMSDTMARPGGQILLEQSDMRRALNMANLATGEFRLAANEETQQLIKKTRAEVREAAQ
jgi:hypothetical protein